MADQVSAGTSDTILIDDGRVALRVRRIEAGRVLCDIIQTGTTSYRLTNR